MKKINFTLTKRVLENIIFFGTATTLSVVLAVKATQQKTPENWILWIPCIIMTVSIIWKFKRIARRYGILRGFYTEEKFEKNDQPLHMGAAVFGSILWFILIILTGVTTMDNFYVSATLLVPAIFLIIAITSTELANEEKKRDEWDVK